MIRNVPARKRKMERQRKAKPPEWVRDHTNTPYHTFIRVWAWPEEVDLCRKHAFHAKREQAQGLWAFPYREWLDSTKPADTRLYDAFLACAERMVHRNTPIEEDDTDTSPFKRLQQHY